jgi:16S rRNA processing protein RimM
VELRVLGTIGRSHGLNGALKVNITADSDYLLEKGEPVFVRLQGGPVPFFIQDIQQANEHSLVMKLDDVDDITKTDRFIGAEVLLPEESFQSSDDMDAEMLIGFSVTDIHHGAIGVVSGIMQLPQQTVLELQFNGKEILVPFVDGIIRSIDSGARTVEVETPDGLIDLYLNG